MVEPDDVLAIIAGHKTPLTLSPGVTINVSGEGEVVVEARFLNPELVETARQQMAREAREEKELAEGFQ